MSDKSCKSPAKVPQKSQKRTPQKSSKSLFLHCSAIGSMHLLIILSGCLLKKSVRGRGSGGQTDGQEHSLVPTIPLTTQQTSLNTLRLMILAGFCSRLVDTRDLAKNIETLALPPLEHQHIMRSPNTIKARRGAMNVMCLSWIRRKLLHKLV